MGLDTYPSRTPDNELTPDDEGALSELDLTLCEWTGPGSFRGKVYLDVVDRVTGVCLTQYWIPPEDVAEMAAAFEARDPEEVARASAHDHYPASADEVRSLRRLFRACADRGLGLCGSF